MEGIFEAILQVFGEIAFGVVEEIVGETIQSVGLSDFWNQLKSNSSETQQFSTEINQLNILNVGKENL